MSVLIKGMEMPKSCSDCFAEQRIGSDFGCGIIGFEDGNTTCFTRERRKDCSLIEVPTPHGRLIDADAMEKECCHGCKNEFHKYENCIDCVLANAPTIIPADPPKEG